MVKSLKNKADAGRTARLAAAQHDRHARMIPMPESAFTLGGIRTELHRLAEMFDPPPLPQPICRDPDDDAVLAVASAANADLIVSGDDDLLSLKRYQGIDIITPAQALQLIGSD